MMPSARPSREREREMSTEHVVRLGSSPPRADARSVDDMGKLRVAGTAIAVVVTLFAVACEDSSSSSGSPGFDAGNGTFDGGSNPPPTDASTPLDATVPTDAADASDGAKVLPDGLSEPIPYLSIADSLFKGVAFPSYYHFEDWEDAELNTPGVSSTTATLGTGALVDSVDGDDGAVNGKCLKKDNVVCVSGFSGSGTIDFTFDAVALGALPTHVGIVWTDGAPMCDAVFEAYDAANVLIGTKTAATVGDADNLGGVAEDRFFSVVHMAGVSRIVVKSSAGGVEVDHLQYGR